MKRRCPGGIWNARRVICEVGTSQGIHDPSLAISTAEAHGRASLAAALKAQVKDKWSEVATHQSAQAGEQPTEVVGQNRDSDQAVQMALSGVRSEEVWASQSGTVYVLMMLDQERFDALVERMTAPTNADQPAAAKVQVSEAKSQPAETKSTPARAARRPGSLDSSDHGAH